jgi:hypothetical protein
VSTAVKTLDDLFKKCVPEPNTGCHIWLGATGLTGYGRTWFRKKTITTHRVAYLLAFGEIPDGMVVCHKCDMPSCCNPGHLFLGTQAENLLDMRAKGRANDPYGEKHPRSKLSDADAAAIRTAVAGGARQKDMAQKYGIAECTVSNLCAGRFRQHALKEQA